MGEDAESRRYLCIGDLVLDRETRELWRGADGIELPPLSYRLLELLVECAPGLATQEQIMERVWKNRVVSPETVTQRVKLLRRALGDDAHDPRYIALVRGEGYRLVAEVRCLEDPDGRESGRPPTGTVWSRIPLAALALLVLGASALAYLPGLLSPDEDGETPHAERIPMERSIAVLPFDDLTADGSRSYLGDGIADELLHWLSQSDELRVVARTSSFALRDSGLDIPAIAARLGVRYVLQGSLRESDQALRITAQLVDARENTQVWSQAYERSADDALTVQRDIATALRDLLEIELATDDRRRVPPAAYERFVQGRYYYNRRAEGDMKRAEQAFLDALGIEPNLPRAWTGLAAVYNVQVWDKGELDKRTALKQQRAALERALSLEPNLASAHARLGRVYRIEGNQEAAERHYQRAWELGGNDPTVLVMRAGWLALHGRLAEAIELQRRAIALDPLAASYRHNFGFQLLAVGRTKEAEAEFETAIGLGNRTREDYAYEFALARILRSEFEGALALVPEMEAVEDRIAVRAMTAHGYGQTETADELSDELAELEGARAILRLAEVRSFRGNPEALFDALDRLESDLEAHEGVLPETDQALRLLRHSPFIGELHAEPMLIERFSEIFDSYYTVD